MLFYTGIRVFPECVLPDQRPRQVEGGDRHTTGRDEQSVLALFRRTRRHGQGLDDADT